MGSAIVVTVVVLLVLALICVVVAVSARGTGQTVAIVGLVVSAAAFAVTVFLGVRGEGSSGSDQPSPIVNSPVATAYPIDIGKACKWAYPHRASGRVEGTAEAITCLDGAGKSLGGFDGDSGHSLNDWCADPAHIGGNSGLRQAEATSGSPTSWQCVPIG